MTEYQINSEDINSVREFISKLNMSLLAKPAKYKVVVKQNQERGSSAQRGYYHAVVVNLYKDFLREQGEAYSHDIVHLDLKNRFRSRLPTHDLITGEVNGERFKDGSEMTIAEWSEYIDLCVMFLTDKVGLIVPDASNYF